MDMTRRFYTWRLVGASIVEAFKDELSRRTEQLNTLTSQKCPEPAYVVDIFTTYHVKKIYLQWLGWTPTVAPEEKPNYKHGELSVRRKVMELALKAHQLNLLSRRGGGARARRGKMAPSSLPRALYNASYDYNLTYDDLELVGNTTDEHDHHWFCAKWTNAQQDLFQAANLCFAIAFLAPKSFKQSILVLRALACAGAVLMGMWAGAEVCAPDVLAWSLALVLVNSVHTIFLIIRFLPPALSLELTELYLKLFKPLRVNKKHFQELTREARVVRLDPGEAYAVEDVTPADERLSILLKGKMRVSCDQTHLHFIQPYQFIDSPEWEANREQSDDVFQVSVVAEEVCTCICWPRMRLERVLRHRPAVKVVLDCLIGKDITHKLYSVSEGLGASTAERDVGSAHLTRSASVDAVHEGTQGRLRSLDWRTRSTKSKGSSYWQPMVARQFLLKSPFARGARLLTQASSASLQPPRTRSPPRRAASFRRAREVKFAETAQDTV